MDLRKYTVVQWIVLILIFAATTSHAKTVSGDFKLDGLNSEHKLSNFAVSAKGTGRVDVQFECRSVNVYDLDIQMYLFRDDDWRSFQLARACRDRVTFARNVAALHFQETEPKELWSAQARFPLDLSNSTRPMYFYFVVADCSLEEYMHDDKSPRIHYHLQAWNDVGDLKDTGTTFSQLSADEGHLPRLHAMTLIFSSILTMLMVLTIVMNIQSKGSVHLALFLVAAAAACDASSSLTEILHLNKYKQDGIGSYSLDAISAHLEAMCDSMVALMLLSVAAGWTLPSDAIVVSQTNQNSLMHLLLGGMRNPFSSKSTSSAWLGLLIVLANAGLAQWGRTYNGDFDSYHDLEHLPGKVIMGMRVFLGLLMVVASVHTRQRCPSPSLQAFYVKVAIVGTLWFQSLPAVTWVCNSFVPFYLRHPTVSIWCAIMQSSSLVLLSWLVTGHSSSYHKVSRVCQSEDALGDKLGNPNGALTADANLWKLGKAKIRLD